MKFQVYQSFWGMGSLPHGGAASMIAPPMTANGLDAGANKTAESSPRPAPRIAAAAPARAATAVSCLRRVSPTFPRLTAFGGGAARP